MTLDRTALDRLIIDLAELHGVRIDSEMLPIVRMHLEIAARMATALDEFPSDEREELAPVFTP